MLHAWDLSPKEAALVQARLREQIVLTWDGRQVSSNVHAHSIDPSAYGQDLSRRPYAVSLSVLNNAAFRGAFLCDPYISRVTTRPCVTVMARVTSGSWLLGYIAADFNPESRSD